MGSVLLQSYHPPRAANCLPNMSVDLLNQILGFGTLSLQVVTIGMLVALVLRNRVAGLQDVIRQVGTYAFHIALALALVSSILTLYYSEVLGFAPCPLCWWQRVFMYPQVIMLALALWKKDTSVWLLSVILSGMGLATALYHHALQMLPAGTLPCPAVGPSCSQIVFLEYGYITYPLMAATLFAFIIVLMLSHRAVSRN